MDKYEHLGLIHVVLSDLATMAYLQGNSTSAYAAMHSLRSDKAHIGSDTSSLPMQILPVCLQVLLLLVGGVTMHRNIRVNHPCSKLPSVDSNNQPLKSRFTAFIINLTAWLLPAQTADIVHLKLKIQKVLELP